MKTIHETELMLKAEAIFAPTSRSPNFSVYSPMPAVRGALFRQIGKVNTETDLLSIFRYTKGRDRFVLRITTTNQIMAEKLRRIEFEPFDLGSAVYTVTGKTQMRFLPIEKFESSPTGRFERKTIQAVFSGRKGGGRSAFPVDQFIGNLLTKATRIEAVFNRRDLFDSLMSSVKVDTGEMTRKSVRLKDGEWTGWNGRFTTRVRPVPAEFSCGELLLRDTGRIMSFLFILADLFGIGTRNAQGFGRCD